MKTFANAGIPFPLGVRTAEQTRRVCEPVDWPDVLRAEAWMNARQHVDSATSTLVVPLQARGRVCGALLFADSPVAPFFNLPDRMDHVKLPCIRKVSAGCWEATRLRMDERELIGIRAKLLRNVLINFRYSFIAS